MFRSMFLSLLVSVFVVGAAKSDMCSDAAGQGDFRVREQYQHTIDYFMKISAAAQSRGFDPRRFPQADNYGNITAVDLIDTIEKISAKRDEGVAAIFQAFQECRSNIAPYQRIVDVGSFYLFGAMQQVIPQSARQIDAGRLLAGTPFGGPNALVPQTREYIMARLGIGGSAADFIRNPLQVTPQGPVRAPWVPMLMPGVPIAGLNIPSVGQLPQLPPLPQLPSPPPPIQVGSVGGHRVCVPWC